MDIYLFVPIYASISSCPASACHAIVYSLKMNPPPKKTRNPGSTDGFQFPDVVEFAEKMAAMGKTVVVAALDGTFQRVVYMCCFYAVVD